MLTFDSATHTYRWNGVPVMSVTQHLQALHSFVGVPEDVLRAACERGTFVHDVTVAHDMDELDEPAVPPEFAGYLQAWKAFVAAAAPNWLDIERMGYSRRFGFAGTWDRLGELSGSWAGRWIIDVKTSEQSHPVWGLQTSAYRQILSEEDLTLALARRGTVQLLRDGKFRFKEWADPADWPTFQSLVTLNHWKQAKCN